jgi:hypothetical protein
MKWSLPVLYIKLGTNYLTLTLLFIFFTFESSAQNVHKEIESVLASQVLKNAEEALKMKPVTVTAEKSERSAGGVHDFYSEGDYWWQNPEDPNGPYIQRDGMSNPAVRRIFPSYVRIAACSRRNKTLIIKI